MQNPTHTRNQEMTHQFEQIWDEYKDPDTIKRKKLEKNRESYGKDYN